MSARETRDQHLASPAALLIRLVRLEAESRHS